MATAHARVHPVKFGLFVEGAHSTDKRRYELLAELWETFSARVTGAKPSVKVFGFSKGQIVNMATDAELKANGIARSSVAALDALIDDCHRTHPFENAIVAFDIKPKNNVIAEDCMPGECRWILRRLTASAVLPDRFKAAAAAAMRSYSTVRTPPRAAARPPLTALELICMEPEFESLFIDDPTTVLRALGLARKPKDFPKFVASSKPKDILQDAIQHFATPPARTRAGGGAMRGNPHGWARLFINEAEEDARLFRHPTATRLAKLLTTA